MKSLGHFETRRLPTKASHIGADSDPVRIRISKFRIHEAIILICKNKGQRNDSNNSRDISLLSVAGKVPVRIMFSRLVNHVPEVAPPESQCGLGKETRTTGWYFL